MRKIYTIYWLVSLLTILIPNEDWSKQYEVNNGCVQERSPDAPMKSIDDVALKGQLFSKLRCLKLIIQLTPDLGHARLVILFYIVT